MKKKTNGQIDKKDITESVTVEDKCGAFMKQLAQVLKLMSFKVLQFLQFHEVSLWKQHKIRI